jgi:hypothetical protein
MARFNKSALLRRKHNRGKAERKVNRSPEAQARLDALGEGTFGTFKPVPTPKKRDKTLYMQRREEGLAKQREHRDATS